MRFLKKKGTTIPTKKSKQKLHYIWILLPLFVAGAIYTLSYIAFHNVPEIVIHNLGSNSDKFVGRYARENLKNLSSLGPRLVGSEANEIRTIKFLTNAVEEIKSNALSKYKIEYQVQTASGSYIIEDMVDIYQDIKNFVVRFSSPCCNSSSALLLNSHFDTVPESSGAGDDGTMVVVMLEVLRVLSNTTRSLKHPIIFLFNGAEENSLQGSHAFITQHEWAKDVKAFINLDVAGLGGREMLFQSGPGHPWLMKYYHKSAIHPYASSIAEEIFQNKLIPSDTDFRIFRDYGNIPGLDMAHSYNGYVYHTKYDRISTISNYGFIQNAGDNVLPLVRSIASSEELENPGEHSEGHTVFFDFLGLFLIFYTEHIGIAINISIAVISITAMAISIWAMSKTMDESILFILKNFGIILSIEIATLILAAAVPIVLALIIDATYSPLFWFSQPWLIFGIYFCPFCFVMAMIPAIYLKRSSKTSPLRFGIQLFLHAYCVILIILVIVMTGLSIRSTFAVTINIAFYTLSVIVNWAVGLQSRPFIWVIPVLVSQIIPVAFYSYLSQIIFTTFIPITGRSGCTSLSDLMIAAFTVIVAVLTTGFLTPLFSILRRPKIVISGFMVVFVIFAITMATPVGLPFTAYTAAERHWVFHTKRAFHEIHTGNDTSGLDPTIRTELKNDSGYILLPLDRYSTISIEEILSRSKYSRTSEDCKEMLVCGVPVYSPEFKPMSNYSYWIPAEPPIIPEDYNATIELESRVALNERTTRFTFVISGPAHMQVFFNPLNQCQLVNWSLHEEFPKKDYFKESTYFIHYRHGLSSNNFEFYLDFEAPAGYEGPIFDIALIAHHNNYPIERTAEFDEFLSIFPEWAVLTPIVSSYESYRIY